MDSSENGENQRTEARPRVDFLLAIESVGELYTGLAPRLSTDGLFIETDQPVPPESEVSFKVTLPDGVVVMRGLGRVMWLRPPESPNDPTGLAVRFSDVDPDARETLDAVIDAHLASGGVLFDLDGGQPGGETFPTDSLDTNFATASGPRWVRDVDGPQTPPSASGGDDAATGENLGVGGLRFEQAIAGFSGGHDQPSEDDRTLDDAIAAAVGLNTDAEETANATAQKASDVIPDVLDQWRRELEVAGKGPLPPEPEVEASVNAKEWESLLPFEPDGDSDLGAPAPWTKPDRTTTSARRDEDQARPLGGWWMIAMAVMAVVVVAVAFAMWVRQNSGAEPAPTPNVAEASVEPLAEPPDAIVPEVLPDPESTRAPAPETAPAMPAPKASILESITWQPDAGQTRVVIRADGVLDRASVDAIRLENPPRVLVRIRAMDRPFKPTRFEVASPEITAIRVGYHPELRPAAMYVVLDLASDDVLSDGALSVANRQAVVTVRTDR